MCKLRRGPSKPQLSLHSKPDLADRSARGMGQLFANHVDPSSI